MSVDVVLNELSAVPLASDEYEARLRMTDFISTLVRAVREGFSGTFRVQENFYAMELAPEYRVTNWFNDSQVDQVERQFLRRRATKSPFLSDLVETHTQSLGYDFKLDAIRAEGCGVAYLLNALSISLLSEARWDVSHIALKVESLDENGSLEEENAEIVHASRPAHILEHHTWIQRRLTESVGSGADMWERRAALFPSLIFCDRVERQMRELEYGTSMLQPVAKVLFDLEAACRTWAQGAFDLALIPAKVSPESAATLQQFEADRRFRCPDGIERVFSLHVKINMNAWRIHFYYDNAQPSSLIIGHIGRHLPTASDRT